MASDRDINTLMSPEFMFTVEVAKELLIIMHSDKQLRDGPLENLWVGGRSTKKIFAQGKIK